MRQTPNFLEVKERARGPLSNGIKIVSVLQRLHGEIGRTNSDVQKRDGQTDRQIDKKLNVFGHPGGG